METIHNYYKEKGKKNYYFLIKLWAPAEFSPFPCSTPWPYLLIAKWSSAPCALKFLICWVYLSHLFYCGLENCQGGVVRQSRTYLHLHIKWLYHEPNDNWQYLYCYGNYQDSYFYWVKVFSFVACFPMLCKPNFIFSCY